MIRVDLFRAHGTRRRYRKGCRCSLCRAATAEHMRIQNHKDIERTRELARIRREKNPGRLARECRNWRERNPGKAARFQKRYREDNPDKCAEQLRAWRISHPQECSARYHNRRVMERDAPGRWTAQDIFDQIIDQGDHCAFCGKSLEEGFHKDHDIPLSRGGDGYPENLLIACPRCNSSKHAFTGVQFMERIYKGEVY